MALKPPYQKTVWKNREVERPRTYNVQENPDGTITLIPAEGQIIEPGTPIIAQYMNNIEDGIEMLDNAYFLHIAENAGKHIKESGYINDCYYIQFDDGTLIQAKSVQYTGTIDTAWGSLYSSDAINLGQWAIPFTAVPYIARTVRAAGASCWIAEAGNMSTVNLGTVYLVRPVADSVSRNYYIHTIAMWRWK